MPHATVATPPCTGTNAASASLRVMALCCLLPPRAGTPPPAPPSTRRCPLLPPHASAPPPAPPSPRRHHRRSSLHGPAPQSFPPSTCRHITAYPLRASCTSLYGGALSLHAPTLLLPPSTSQRRFSAPPSLCEPVPVRIPSLSIARRSLPRRANTAAYPLSVSPPPLAERETGYKRERGDLKGQGYMWIGFFEGILVIMKSNYIFFLFLMKL